MARSYHQDMAVEFFLGNNEAVISRSSSDIYEVRSPLSSSSSQVSPQIGTVTPLYELEGRFELPVPDRSNRNNIFYRPNGSRSSSVSSQESGSSLTPPTVPYKAPPRHGKGPEAVRSMLNDCLSDFFKPLCTAQRNPNPTTTPNVVFTGS